MNTVRASQCKGLVLKIAIAWFCIFLLGGFLIATRAGASGIAMSVIPEVPKAGEPIVATFSISNSSDVPSTTSYQLYVDGRLVEGGSVVLSPFSSSKYQYAYTSTLERGEQVNFVLRTSSAGSSFDKVVSLPAYPPQLMSSFVSFAAFSTSVMSSMITMEYFTDTFGAAEGLNVGIIVCVVLIALLIFMELTQVVAAGRGITLLDRYRASFRNLSAVLFIIFIGMLFTRVVMVLAT